MMKYLLIIILIICATPSLISPAYAQTINYDHTIDGGVFLFMAIIALVCFVFAFRYNTAMIIITVIILFIFTIMMFANYDITLVTITTSSADTFVTTNCIICNNHHFVAYVFSALAILVSLLFFKLTIGGIEK